MAAIGSLVVSLIAETAEFTTGMRRAENDVTRLSKHVASTGNAFSKLGPNAADAISAVEDLNSAVQRAMSVQDSAEVYRSAMEVATKAASTYESAVTTAATATKALTLLTTPWGLAFAAAATVAAAGVKLLLDAHAELNREIEKGLALDEKINKFHADRAQAELDAVRASAAREKAVMAGARAFGASAENGLRFQIETFGMSQSEADLHRLRQEMWQWRNDNHAVLQEMGPFGNFLRQQVEQRIKNIEALQQELDKLREQADAQEQVARAAEEAARAQERLQKTMLDAGRSIQEGLMTPLEAYERKLQDIMALEEIGALDRAAADRAAAAAKADLERAGGKAPGQQQRDQATPGALLFGTAQAFNKEANRDTDALVKLGERQVAVQEKNLPLLGRLGDVQKVALFSFT